MELNKNKPIVSPPTPGYVKPIVKPMIQPVQVTPMVPPVQVTPMVQTAQPVPQPMVVPQVATPIPAQPPEGIEKYEIIRTLPTKVKKDKTAKRTRIRKQKIILPPILTLVGVLALLGIITAMILDFYREYAGIAIIPMLLLSSSGILM